jgi:hypothetical protein
VQGLRPFLLPLFTELPRRGLLGSCLYAPSCQEKLFGKFE